MSASTWTPGRIGTAWTPNGGTRAKRDRVIEAVVLDGGVWAVHPTLGCMTDDLLWTVSHVPTGYAAIRDARDEAAARAAAEAFAALGLDWLLFVTRGAFLALPKRTQTRLKTIIRRAR